MDSLSTLSALFLSSFLGATLLPGGSELVLLAALRAYPETLWLALVIATVGNTLGGMPTYALGRLAPSRPIRGLAYLQRWGAPALLLSWVPVLGDPLCVAAGWLRLPLWPVLVFMAAGKFARYWVIGLLSV